MPITQREAAPATGSVYQRVLGDRFGSLHPQLQRYFGAIPSGSVGTGSGVYEFAGSRRRFLRPLLAWLAWRHILFPERGCNVPFTVTNVPDAGGSLTARRVFSFPNRLRVMEDTISVVDGELVDRLGRRRGLEIALRVDVLDGCLRMTSGSLKLRVGGLRIPLPRVATVTLDERLQFDRPGRQSVDVRITSPWIGEVFRYRGSFVYRVVQITSAS